MATQSLFYLIKLDSNIIDYYQNANKLWKDIREKSAFYSTEYLSAELTNSQFLFEQQCGGKYLGREIMAIVGIGQFYTEEIGFEAYHDEVQKVYNAFNLSKCSIEVKLFVNKTANIFGLTEVNEIEV